MTKNKPMKTKLKKPFCPTKWEVVEHRGIDTWTPNVELFLSEKQKTGYISGEALREELKGKPVMNANVLDYLLKNPALIPETWKGKYVYFWGTIYRDSGGSLDVRCLYWAGDGWSWGYGWRGYGWSVDDPAALRASSLTFESLRSDNIPFDPSSLEQRVARIEKWIDMWESFDAGWNTWITHER